MIGIFFGGLLKSALSFLRRLPWQVWAAIGAVVAALLLWHAHTNAQKAAFNTAFNKGWAAQKVYTDVYRASLDKALSAIDDQNRAVQALSAESAARINAADKARIAAQEAARASLDTARALDASAGVVRAKDGPCVPSETFLENSGSL